MSAKHTNTGRSMRVPLGNQFAYGIGIAGPIVFYIAPQLVLLYFLTDVLAVPPAWAATALLLPKIWEVACDPAIGVVSDRTTSRWGRRRPYLVAGAILFPITFALLFSVPPWTGWQPKLLYVGLLFLACTTAYSLFLIPFSAVGVEMTADPQERTRVIAFRLSFATLAMLVFGTIIPIMVRAGDRAAYSRMAIELAIVSLICMTVGILGTRGTRRTSDEQQPLHFNESIRAMLSNQHFVVLAAIFCIQNIAVNGSVAILPYYSKYVWGDEAQAGTIFLVFFVGVLAGTPLCTWLAVRHGRFRVFAGATIVYAITNASLFWMGPGSAYVFYAALLVSGIGSAAGNLFTYALLPEAIDHDTRRTRRSREGLFNGVWLSLDKLNTAVGAACAGLVLSATGYVASTSASAAQPVAALLAIRLLLTIVPSVVLLLSLVPISLYPGFRMSSMTDLKPGALEEGSVA